LSTDAVINDAIVRAALERVTAPATLLILPAQNIGLSPEHTSFAGTLSIRDATLLDAWTDLGRSAARTGVRKLIVFNTHGGQKALIDLLAMRLRTELGMLTVRATYFAFGALPGLFEETIHDIHGGEVETSLMLHLRPDLVRTSELADFTGLPHELGAKNRLLGAEKPVGIGWRAEDLNPAGACGNAARADGRRGAQHLAYLAERLAALIGEVAATPLTILR
jgi:creatinine amidohydrolase